MANIAVETWPVHAVKQQTTAAIEPVLTFTLNSCSSLSFLEQEAQLSTRDRAMRHVNWNLANCHVTVQKLVVRQVLNKSKLWSWKIKVGRCVINMCTQPWRIWVAFIVCRCHKQTFDGRVVYITCATGATPVEFRGDLWLHRTRVPGLSCGVVYVILRLAVLVELRLVADTDTTCCGKIF